MNTKISNRSRYEISIHATDLRCDYLRNPLGIDVPCPRLSWTVLSGEEGEKQTAYRVLASSSAELSSKPPDLWDSRKKMLTTSSHVPYDGPPLRSAQRVYWRVQLWDRDDNPGPVSDAAWWEMGLLDDSDWKGKWIAGQEPCPYFRKVFTVSRPIRSVRLYICGQGVYQARLNGKALSDQVMGSQLSHYPKRMLYDTFDVTSLMKQEENAVAVWLAPG